MFTFIPTFAIMETILIEISNNLERNLSFNELELFRKYLADKINYLLINDFASLVQLLYRIDIDEKKLKENLLQNKEEQASIVIADMMIKRISTTLETKKKFRKMYNNEMDEGLKW